MIEGFVHFKIMFTSDDRTFEAFDPKEGHFHDVSLAIVPMGKMLGPLVFSIERVTSRRVFGYRPVGTALRSAPALSRTFDVSRFYFWGASSAGEPESIWLPRIP
jgi:hypothetical protein